MSKMSFTRVRSYSKDGKFTGCEHVYARGQVKALEWFRKDYPEHKDCIVIAETVEDDLDNPSDWLRAVSHSGCLHIW